MGIPGSQNGGTLVPYFWPYELGVYPLTYVFIVPIPVTSGY